jgi:hypothetical protein
MKNQPSSCIATSAALSLALLCVAVPARAEPAGTVMHTSGVLFAHHESGRVKVLAPRSGVGRGDTLVSGKGAYAMVKLVDGSAVTLRPESQLRIGHLEWTLVAGAVRINTAADPGRANVSPTLATPLGTITVGANADLIVEYVPEIVTASRRVHLAWVSPQLMQAATASDASPGRVSVAEPSPMRSATPLAQGIPAGPTSGTGLPPGLHVQVLSGMIAVTNHGVTQAYQAGQFGFVRNLTMPPVLVPNNPELRFIPPPAFSAGNPASGSANHPSSSNAVDCVVR